jgi:hypothetical protein
VTSTSPPAPFDCPLCAAHVDEVAISIDADVINLRPLVPAWDGGPLIEDHGAPLESRVVDQILSTNACAHTFRMSMWKFALTTYVNGSSEVVSGHIELTEKAHAT